MVGDGVIKTGRLGVGSNEIRWETCLIPPSTESEGALLTSIMKTQPYIYNRRYT